MLNYSIIVMTIAFIIWLQVRIKEGGKHYKKDFESFFDKEREANVSRIKEIPQKYFVEVNVKSLPFRQYANDETYLKVAARQDKVKKLINNKMIKFEKPMSNREIKLEFGIANLEYVTTYEENFHKFQRALLEWAEQLIFLEEYEDAKVILLLIINLGTDISKNYILLTDVYLKQKDKKGINELIENVKNNKIFENNEIIRNKILSYILSNESI